MIATVALTLLVSTAALVVGVVNLTQRSTSPSAGTSTTATSSPSSAPSNHAEADRALCTAIAPLMSESDREAKAYSTSGPEGSPSRDAATKNFLANTKDWLGRIQPLIDTHPDADPFLLRSLQRFVDDRKFFVLDLEAGPWQPYDQTIWDETLGAYNGPLSVCWGLGVKW